MFALFALLVVGATAAPQVPLYQYPVYPQYQYYGYQPQLRYIPSPVYPSYYYPGAVSAVQAQTRGLFGLPDFTIPGFQSATAGFQTIGSGSKMVLQGNVEFKQNPLTGSSSQYTVYLVDGGDVKVAGTEFQIYLSTTECTSSTTATTVKTGTQLTTITAPSLLVNGFYAKGTSSKFNVDGTDGKTKLDGAYYLYILNSAGDTINGCTGRINKN